MVKNDYQIVGRIYSDVLAKIKFVDLLHLKGYLHREQHGGRPAADSKV